MWKSPAKHSIIACCALPPGHVPGARTESPPNCVISVTWGISGAKRNVNLMIWGISVATNHPNNVVFGIPMAKHLQVAQNHATNMVFGIPVAKNQANNVLFSIPAA